MSSVAFILYAENRVGVISSTDNHDARPLRLISGLFLPYKAPPIEGIDAWINSKPLAIADLKGHVVLIDFWTYSCINCKRTLPYLIDWYKKYHNEGLVIIGVHSPEFEFEKNPENVKQAVKGYGIEYPVALDNQFTTWRNYHNQYWPAQYLINKQGDVVYRYFGEGHDAVTENNIRYLLGLHSMPNASKSEDVPLFSDQTPETYLGFLRAENFSSLPAVVKNKPQVYAFPLNLAADGWALQGLWTILSDRITANQSNAAVRIQFHARHVFVVMGNQTKQPIHVKVLLNDKAMPSITVDKHALFDVIHLDQAENGLLELISTEPGLEIYTFTFG